MSQSLWLQQLKNGTYGNYLPTVNEVQADDCLQMAIQSLVTEVSGWVKSILGLQNGASHITVVPEVFSYVSTPPKHCPLTWLLRLSKVGNRWYQIYVVLRCLCKKKRKRKMRTFQNRYLNRVGYGSMTFSCRKLQYEFYNSKTFGIFKSRR